MLKRVRNTRLQGAHGQIVLDVGIVASGVAFRARGSTTDLGGYADATPAK